jgi:hypothetical protein
MYVYMYVYVYIYIGWLNVFDISIYNLHVWLVLWNMFSHWECHHPNSRLIRPTEANASKWTATVVATLANFWRHFRRMSGIFWGIFRTPTDKNNTPIFFEKGMFFSADFRKKSSVGIGRGGMFSQC